ncbi:Ig-like domain-containing protein, partial [Pseudomonas aeruginosa]|uniref:Ig-like domain-containing protein n=1 Tax=Pseudomonas aeruginosa TaxID=287 RepID=UPI001604CB94
SLSTFAVFPDVIVAETGRANVTLTLKDDEGNPLSGFDNKIALTPSPSLQSTITPFKEGQKGVYHAQISALKTGMMSLSARVDNVDIKQTATLTVIPNSPSAKVKNFTISDTRPHAGDTITYKAYLIDNHDNPVGKGVPVTWTTNEGSQLEKPLTLTDDKGVATVNLYRGPAGIAKVSATLISGTYHADDVSFVADNVDENKSELTLLPAKIIANGRDSAVLSLLIKDKGGNILPSQTVQA